MERIKDLFLTGGNGADIKLMIGDKVIADIQAIGAKEIREMTPIYTMPDFPLRKSAAVAGNLVIWRMYDKEACENEELKTVEAKLNNEEGDHFYYYINGVDLLGTIDTELAITFVGKEILKGDAPNGSKRE